MMKKNVPILLILATSIILAALIFLISNSSRSQFNGEKALASVNYQLDLGPRIPGSSAHTEEIDWISAELRKNGWEVETQEAVALGYPIKNIIAKRGAGMPWIIIGAHYDTRLMADRDPDPAKWYQPVPGANDGASGVAVLLELARVLPRTLDGQVWLVFFDAEDNGNLPGWEWILGSTSFVEQLSEMPNAVVIVDMVGDKDLNLYLEKNSDPGLRSAIWKTAADLGYREVFIPAEKHSILDDHTPFLRAGIPAVDIIDFDYPYWHTTMDTADKVSARSLEIVGSTLYTWLLGELK